ncbi:MAG: FtsX-like permease family protein [Candidatus Krumholzibacteria bacterium]|nr:FtsX-like permease family protein [Candidatus Krumholzibacteria bacterium]
MMKLAWRNILRNKRRTLIAGTAIGIGLAAMIFVDALFEGMSRYMIRSATASFLGEAQIHRKEFRGTYDVDLTIVHLDSVTARLDRSPLVHRYAVRAMTFAMIASPRNSTGVAMIGVEPDRERAVSQIDDAIRDGAFFAGDAERDIVIGSKLADLLEVEIGDRVVLTATQARTGDLAQELFRVSGIYHFNIREMDEGMAFVRLSRARAMLALGDDGAHEVAVAFADPQTARDPALSLWSELSTGGNEALGWPGLLPQIATILRMSNLNLAISGAILFGVVALGIINTLFMSIYERMFEFGVLRALGTRRRALLRLVMLEAASLAVVSIVIGMFLGFGLTLWISRVGIDYGNIEMGGVTIRDRIYPLLQWSQYVVYPAWALVLTTLVGIYPAFHAGRVAPATAMRRAM